MECLPDLEFPNFIPIHKLHAVGIFIKMLIPEDSKCIVYTYLLDDSSKNGLLVVALINIIKLAHVLFYIRTYRIV